MDPLRSHLGVLKAGLGGIGGLRDGTGEGRGERARGRR